MQSSTIAMALEGARLNALLVAVLELNLCAQLAEGSMTVAELARRAGVSIRGCQALADGMVGLRLWTVQAGTYRLTPQAEQFLVPGRSEYVGDQHPELFRIWLDTFSRTADLVRRGEPAHPMESAETLRFWSLLTPVLARKGRRVPQQAIAALALDRAAPRLVDVGGGAEALYTRAFLSAYPTGSSTQVDWPHINAAAREAVHAAGLADRFDTVDGDFHDVQLRPDYYDVAVLSHIIHQESPETNLELLRKLHSALRLGGRVILSDWVVRDGRTGPASSLFFNFTAFLLSPGGKSYEEAEIADLLVRAGFTPPTFTEADDRATLAIAQVASAPSSGVR